jgi:hypothetical protein
MRLTYAHAKDSLRIESSGDSLSLASTWHSCNSLLA